MTNSTPHLVAWMVEYQKYIDLVEKNAFEAAAELKLWFEVGLQVVELFWAELEFASIQRQ